MAIAIGVLGAASGCKPARAPTPAAGPIEPRTPAGSTVPATQAARVDGRIMGVVNRSCDKLAGEAAVAKRRAVDPQLRRLAQAIVEHCASYMRDQRNLAGTLSLTPEDSPAATKLQVRAPTDLAELSAKDDIDFDHEFLTLVIADQDQLLGLVDSTLVPTANHPQLKALLDLQLRSSLEIDLARSRELQRTLFEKPATVAVPPP